MSKGKEEKSGTEKEHLEKLVYESQEIERDQLTEFMSRYKENCIYWLWVIHRCDSRCKQPSVEWSK